MPGQYMFVPLQQLYGSKTAQQLKFLLGIAYAETSRTHSLMSAFFGGEGDINSFIPRQEPFLPYGAPHYITLGGL